MKLTHQEIGCMIFAAQTDKTGKEARKFQFIDLGLASEIGKKVQTHVKDGQIAAGEYDLDFSTEEKAKLLEWVKEHEWTMGDAETAISLSDKLS